MASLVAPGSPCGSSVETVQPLLHYTQCRNSAIGQCITGYENLGVYVYRTQLVDFQAEMQSISCIPST